jgi:hypothetical protein
MVRLGRGVECSAKKAMTTLRHRVVAMGLLRNRDPARLIFLGAEIEQKVNHKMGREVRPG